MSKEHLSFRDTPDALYAYIVYEVGSFVCCNSEIVANHVLGSGVNPTQWRLSRTPADKAHLIRTGRGNGMPPATKRPAEFRFAAALGTRAAELRKQLRQTGGTRAIAAVAFRAAGNVLVAGPMQGFEDKPTDEFDRFGVRYYLDSGPPNVGGLDVAAGIFDPDSRQFTPALAGTNIFAEGVGVPEFRAGGQYENTILQ